MVNITRVYLQCGLTALNPPGQNFTCPLRIDCFRHGYILLLHVEPELDRLAIRF